MEEGKVRKDRRKEEEGRRREEGRRGGKDRRKGEVEERMRHLDTPLLGGVGGGEVVDGELGGGGEGEEGGGEGGHSHALGEGR